MTPATEAIRTDFRSEWSQMDRKQRRRAIRTLGIFAAVDLVGVHPVEVVLAFNGSSTAVDQQVRRSLDTCRAFFGANP